MPNLRTSSWPATITITASREAVILGNPPPRQCPCKTSRLSNSSTEWTVTIVTDTTKETGTTRPRYHIKNRLNAPRFIKSCSRRSRWISSTAAVGRTSTAGQFRGRLGMCRGIGATVQLRIPTNSALSKHRIVSIWSRAASPTWHHQGWSGRTTSTPLSRCLQSLKNLIWQKKTGFSGTKSR